MPLCGIKRGGLPLEPAKEIDASAAFHNISRDIQPGLAPRSIDNHVNLSALEFARQIRKISLSRIIHLTNAELLRQIQTTLNNIQHDQIVERIAQKPLQNQQAHKSTAHDHNAIPGLNLAMVNTRNSAGHGFDNPVFIRQIGFRNLENALFR